MTTLTGAFDVSERPDRAFLVMAGFVSRAEEWEAFDKKWRARLEPENLPFFHMSKFAQGKSTLYRDWPERRRQGLMRDLLDLISESAFRKFGVVVQADAVRSLQLAVDQRNLTMIRTAGSSIAGEVEQWRTRSKFRQPVRLVFEDGDNEKGSLMKAIKQITGSYPVFASKKDILHKNIIGFSPLQAADIFAYELKKVAEVQGVLPIPKHYRFRFPYEQLNKIPGDAHLIDSSSAIELCELARIDKYFWKNPLTGKLQR